MDRLTIPRPGAAPSERGDRAGSGAHDHCRGRWAPGASSGCTADGAIVSVRQIALVGRERFAGIWPWGPEAFRVRVTVPDGTRLDASVDAGSISAEHSWDQARVHADAGSIVIGTLRDGSVRAQAGSVRIRSTTGTVSAHTEAGSVKVLAAYEGLLDLC